MIVIDTSALIAIQFGEPYTLPKKRVAVKVDPAVLDSYVGEYQLAPSMSFKIERDGDALTLEPTGQPKTRILASSETEFFLTVVDATLKFITPEITGQSMMLKLGETISVARPKKRRPKQP